MSGMSALVTDLKDLCEKEEPVYVGIAVLLASIAMHSAMNPATVVTELPTTLASVAWMAAAARRDPAGACCRGAEK